MNQNNSYPLRLVPSVLDSVDISPNPEHLLCRRVDEGIELKTDDGWLHPDAVYLENEQKKDGYKVVFNYSTNKIPNSTVEDVFIIFNDNVKYRQEWIEGTDGTLPSDNEYKYQTERGAFLFKIKEIDCFSARYPYKYPNSPSADYIFTVYVKHRPTISNICHYELQISYENIDGSPIGYDNPGKGSAAAKIIAAEIRQKLLKISKFKEEEFV